MRSIMTAKQLCAKYGRDKNLFAQFNLPLLEIGMPASSLARIASAVVVLFHWYALHLKKSVSVENNLNKNSMSKSY